MAGETTRAPSGLREMTRQSVRQRISDAAIDLFSEYGFDNVTVEQIASTVGMSARSFNRYFPSKEDTVIPDSREWGEFVRDALAARPDQEPVWDSLQAAYQALLGLGESGERERRAMRVLTSAASLRARNLEKHLMWSRMIIPVVTERLDGPDASLRAELLVQASLVCFDIALVTWAEPGESRSPGELLATAFATLAPSS